MIICLGAVDQTEQTKILVLLKLHFIEMRLKIDHINMKYQSYIEEMKPGRSLCDLDSILSMVFNKGPLGEMFLKELL